MVAAVEVAVPVFVLLPCISPYRGLLLRYINAFRGRVADAMSAELANVSFAFSRALAIWAEDAHP